MKRSEMVEIINETILGNYPLAETILNKIEDAGMLPPPVRKANVNTGLFHGQKYYEWESEDSEKGK